MAEFGKVQRSTYPQKSEANYGPIPKPGSRIVRMPGGRQHVAGCDMEGRGSGELSDPAFRAVERVVTGAVSKVLSKYRQRPSRSRVQPPAASSDEEEDFIPPPRKTR